MTSKPYKSSAFTGVSNFTPAQTHKPSRNEVFVESWQEGDRLGIWIADRLNQKTIVQWWDNKARQMFDDGFFKPATHTASGSLGGPEFINSVLDYAEEMGFLASGGEKSRGGITRIYFNESPFSDEERKEFRQMLKDRPELKKSYIDFKVTSSQKLRFRLGQSPFLDKALDKLFEIAAISGE